MFWKGNIFILVLFFGVMTWEYVQCIPERKYPLHCAEASNGTEGVYTIQYPNHDPIKVYCINDRNKRLPAWTVIFRRFKLNLNFNRQLAEYEDGFGSIVGDHFLGLRYIHKLTNLLQHDLWIQLKGFGRQLNSRYTSFAIGNKNEDYILHTLGAQLLEDELPFDSFRTHHGNRFSTLDRDFTKGRCSKKFSAGWWFYEDPYYLKGDHNCCDACLIQDTDGGNKIGKNAFQAFDEGNKGQATELFMAIRPSVVRYGKPDKVDYCKT